MSGKDSDALAWRFSRANPSMPPRRGCPGDAPTESIASSGTKGERVDVIVESEITCPECGTKINRMLGGKKA